MKMKKVVLSLAGVLAAAAFAPEASAVPVFARQTGMACSACHFNHFPLLNAFGRSFKSSGYTLMGAQGKVEGEDLSIPDRLNMAVLTTAGWEGNSASPDNTVVSRNGFYVPTNGGELSIFFGGRMTEYSGFLSELGLTGNGAATNGVGVPSAKMLILPEVADGIRAGVSVFSIGQGAAGSFELLNTGATSIHRIMGRASNHLAVASARQYVAPENAKAGNTANRAGETGVGVIVNSDKFFVNVAKYAAVGSGAIKQTGNLPGTYVRAAYLFDLAGFDTAIGFQNWGGGKQQPAVQSNAGAWSIATLGEDKATVIDFQMQGDLAGKGFGFYASYGKAPFVSTGNNFNAGTVDRKSFNIAADYSVMPKTTVQAAYRSAKNGTAGESDNAFMIGAAYELAMNQHLALNYTSQSGNAWNATGSNKAVVGKNQTTLLLETLF